MIVPEVRVVIYLGGGKGLKLEGGGPWACQWLPSRPGWWLHGSLPVELCVCVSYATFSFVTGGQVSLEVLACILPG